MAKNLEREVSRSIMASTLLLLQLLLVTLTSASHHFGGIATFTYRGQNPDGTFEVDLHNKAAFRSCHYFHHWHCYNGNCGYISGTQKGVIDGGSTAPSSTRQWCETETITTRTIPSDKPFYLRAASCCWVSTRNNVINWNLLTYVDLGTRSDTRKPNRSPASAILPFLRVPQNCPRSYNLLSFDPDGDKVRCRYGAIRNLECSTCDQPRGFSLDQDSCTLHYHYSSADFRVYGFEMVIEDFSQRRITLSYSDGTLSVRGPQTLRGKRQAPIPPFTSATTSEATTAETSTSTTYSTFKTPTTTTYSTTETPTTTTYSTAYTTATTAAGATTAEASTATTATTSEATTATTATTYSTAYTTATTAAGATTAETSTATTATTSEATTATTATTYSTAYTTATTAAGATTRSTTPYPPTSTHVTTPPWWHGVTTQTSTTFTPHTTAPFSKIPFQFSLLVDPPVPSCQEGLFLPKLVYPTPKNGDRILGEVNKETEIRVKAHVTNSVIRDIIMTGPINITKHKTTHDEFVLRWTPDIDDLGKHFPVCFAVESIAGSRIYQSEMRCVLVEVKKQQVQSTVICGESTMTILVEKSSLQRIREDRLQLSDPASTACRLQSNSTHISAVFPLNACGTQIEEDDDYLYFKNELTTFDSNQTLITRKNLLELEFYCRYPKRGNVTLAFSAHRKNLTVWERGFGTFTYNFEFYPDRYFQTRMDPNSYPLEFYVGDRIYMQIQASSSVNNTELFVETCRAAPYDNPNSKPTYPIIENGCILDSTVETYSTGQRQFQFSMEAFKFIGLHEQVYISCSVLMCEAGAPDTRCSQGCIKSLNGQQRKKREAITQSSTHLVSQGPLRLKRSAEQPAGSVLNLNLVFIAGCLLAAVGIISAVVLYKTKMSRAGYQRLSASEH